MAITGISAISGEQIIAAGAVSAKEAATASFTTGGNDIQNLYDTVSTNSASWTGGGGIDSAEASAIASSYADSAKNVCWPMVSNASYFKPTGQGFKISYGSEQLLVGKSYDYMPMEIDFTYGGYPTANFHLGPGAVYGGNLNANTSYYYNLRWNGISGRYYDATANSACYWQYTLDEYNKLTSTHDTVSANSASWGAGADYSAGKNISITDDVISTTDTISVTGDVQVENSTETQVTSVTGTVWGTNYYGHYASLNSSYKITVSGTPANLGVYVYDFDYGGYYINGLTTADLQNFTISGLSSLPNAVTSKIGDWSTTDWIEGAEFGIQDPSYNPGYDEGMPAWPVSSTLYSLVGSNISLSGLNDFIETNSASWTASGPSYTGDAQGALDEVYSNSANWDGSYDTLTANSASWTAAGNTLGSNSGKWNQTYNTVSSNSATWGGSILNVSAGPGVKINLVNDTLVFGADETVLWSGNLSAVDNAQLTANEDPLNFQFLDIYMNGFNDGLRATEVFRFVSTNKEYCLAPQAFQGLTQRLNHVRFQFNGTVGTCSSTIQYLVDTNGVRTAADRPGIVKVVGINRTAGNS